MTPMEWATPRPFARPPGRTKYSPVSPASLRYLFEDPRTLLVSSSLFDSLAGVFSEIV